jgi:hypothetical protein
MRVLIAMNTLSLAFNLFPQYSHPLHRCRLSSLSVSFLPSSSCSFLQLGMFRCNKLSRLCRRRFPKSLPSMSQHKNVYPSPRTSHPLSRGWVCAWGTYAGQRRHFPGESDPARVISSEDGDERDDDDEGAELDEAGRGAGRRLVNGT